MEKITKQIEDLKEKELALRRKRSNLEYEYTKSVALPNLRKSIGKCFKYMNTYGVGDGMKYWPLFTKIVGIDEKSMSFTCIQFQRTSMNFVEVKLDQKSNFDGENYFDRSGDWKPILLTEYNRAKKNIWKLLQEKLSQ